MFLRFLYKYVHDSCFLYWAALAQVYRGQVPVQNQLRTTAL